MTAPQRQITDFHGHAAPRTALMEARGRNFMPFPADPPSALWDRPAQLEEMAATGLIRRLVSVPPILYGYELPAPAQVAQCRALNDWLAAFVAASPLKAAAILPLGDPAAALAELRRCRETLGIEQFAIGTHIHGAELDVAVPGEIWAALAEAPGITMMHPWKTRDDDRLHGHRLGNYLGNPFETATAAARLIFSGIVERFEHFPIMLAHGGGALPALFGRMDHGWNAARASGADDGPSLAPSVLARRFYYDTVVFSDAQLELLVRLVGADRVLPGTDSPFDMGMVGVPPLLPACGAAAPRQPEDLEA